MDIKNNTTSISDDINSTPNTDENEKSAEELEKEMQKTLEEATQSNQEFEEKNGAMLEEIENEPEIPADDPQDDAEIAQLEKEIGEDLDQAMIDLSTKKEDEDKEEL